MEHHKFWPIGRRPIETNLTPAKRYMEENAKEYKIKGVQALAPLNEKLALRYYKLDPLVPSPRFATEDSACFDIHAWQPWTTEIFIARKDGSTITNKVPSNRTCTIYPGHTALVPTGLIFDIPRGYVLQLFARSGLAFNRGLSLGNSVGIIDSDYVEPIFVMIHNRSDIPRTIANEERICQGMLLPIPKYDLVTITEKPEQKTDRTGGFGSTGTK